MRDALIIRLQSRLEMMRQVGIAKDCDLDSPEVQNKRVYGIDLTIGEVRLILDDLIGK